MICPVCNVSMVIVEYDDIELDYCTTCKGVWFDSGELELLMESAGLDNARVFLDNVVGRPEVSTDEKKRRCPICMKKMKKEYMDEGAELLVDICKHEHGIWFDGMEVHHLMELVAGKSPDKEDASRQVVDFLSEVFKY